MPTSNVDEGDERSVPRPPVEITSGWDVTWQLWKGILADSLKGIATDRHDLKGYELWWICPPWNYCNSSPLISWMIGVSHPFHLGIRLFFQRQTVSFKDIICFSPTLSVEVFNPDDQLEHTIPTGRGLETTEVPQDGTLACQMSSGFCWQKHMACLEVCVLWPGGVGFECFCLTLPKFNVAKNDGWKTSLSYWVLVTFQGRTVKLREGTFSFGRNV